MMVKLRSKAGASPARRRWAFVRRGGPGWALLVGTTLALADVALLQRLHAGVHEAHELSPFLHLLRDGALAAPLAAVCVWAASRPRARRLLGALLPGGRLAAPAGLLWWALLGATAFAVATVPGSLLHARLFGAGHAGGVGFAEHAAQDAAAALLGAIGVLLAIALAGGGPWGAARPRMPVARRSISAIALSALVTGLLVGGAAPVDRAQARATAFQCESLPGTRTIVADVVALDQSLAYNRLGVVAPGGMMYALRNDVVVKTGADAGKPVTQLSGPEAASQRGNIGLREGKRPRPLALRMNVGDCLRISFQNLLVDAAHDDQPADRHVGIHVNGLLRVDAASAGSNVGKNTSSLVAPGESTVYTLYGEHENTFLIENLGVTVGSEGNGGTLGLGLFGAVNVEPFGSVWYRSQVSRDEMDLASTGETADDHPIIDYGALYPAGSDPALAGRPILNILDGNSIVHSDLNAIIAGPAADGYRLPERAYPRSYWENRVFNMDESRGAEPFREFTIVFHDEIKAVQAFPLFNDPRFRKTLAGVKDGFAINYGTGGIGAEIIANRLGVGPMWDCTECKYEEFFLTSWAVGDPAMVVDNPANSGLRATRAFYPDDPSNVQHSYVNDRVKFRNLHAGPKEHHIFHLHAHQWTFTPNTKKSTYLDSQLIGPGSGYTYEIAFGGSGNRNKSPGDAIFHCHFYPHFAQGMWALWRNHDVFERGTELDAAGRPATGSRALPDGEITAGTPIPGVVPLPGRPLAPMPQAPAAVVPYDLDDDNVMDSSQLDVDGNGTADMDEGFATATKLAVATLAGATTVTVQSATGMRSGQALAIGTGTPEKRTVASIAGSVLTLDAPLAAPHAAADPVVRADNPGFPFFIPGVAGHRPPTPAIDLVDANGDGQVEDGGLPRHLIVGGKAVSFETPLDFNKTIEKAKVLYVPEAGTPAEKAAMAFHGQLWHDTFTTDGTPVDAASPLIAPGNRKIKGFETNGMPPVRGAPYAEPCRSDRDADGNVTGPIGTSRTYKAAVVQADVVLNKLGWHFPQQRFEVLSDDVGDVLAKKKAPEPLVMRLGANDCAEFWHTNLVPNVYELDDYQVRTPTDIIGQHIHLVKFDVTSADGSGNGFNYEDGTFSPQEVVERIDAVRAQTGTCTGNDRIDEPGEVSTEACPLARAHPSFKDVPGVGDLAWGARTTVQRWYADPILNDSWDKGLGAVFTHDHYGPSTHQQVGLYSTVLVEPESSQWRDPESGTLMGSRGDGGPTSWKADILTTDPVNSHREFYFEFADFQHAYHAGGGTLRTQDNGAGVEIPSYADFLNAVNPSFRQEPPAGKEKDLYFYPGTCANGLPRPCPEAITVDDAGTFVVNFRNEPIGLRVFDPNRKDPVTGLPAPGQAAGLAGDLAAAFQSRTDRAIPALNTQPAFYPPLTSDLKPGDPWTPMMRAYAGDKVRIRAQVGATEEQHNLTVHGLKWRQEEHHLDSGWRNSQASGISEYFNLETPVLPDIGQGNPASIDYLYAMGAATDDLWNGNWGLLRSYNKGRTDLLKLPNNPIPDKNGWPIANQSEFNQTCPIKNPVAPLTTFSVTAVRAADVLGPNGLVYNNRTTSVLDRTGAVQGAGPLIDPTAILYVNTSDLVIAKGGKPVGLKPGTPVEPLVLRANAGDCIKLTLSNKLPKTVPDMPGYNVLPGIVHKEHVNGGVLTFNNNDLTPSSLVGLHPQLVEYDMRKAANGFDAGGNSTSLVAPGAQKTYVWYAGDVDWSYDNPGSPTAVRLSARPVEFGAAGLMPADAIKGSEKGMVGALVIEPPGATWTTDAGTRMSATVSFPGGGFREFVAVLQTDINLRYGGGCSSTAANLGCAVPGMASEALLGPAEDAEDSGQKAINYGAEPLWFRLGVDPTMPFESPALLGNTSLHKVYSNELVGGADPQTAVFTAAPGQQVRVRLLVPGGRARGAVMALDGHAWQREPYVNASDRIGWGSHGDPTTLNGDPATMPDHNMDAQWIGSQEGVAASSHFDFVVPQAGGPFAVTGDYLFRDMASFGNYQGLWGIVRVESP